MAPTHSTDDQAVPTAMTVLGPVPVDELGIMLTHEHILIDVGANGPEPEEASRKGFFHRPLTMDILGEVRMAPQSNRDNQLLTDIDLMTREVQRFADQGGRSIMDTTSIGIGRDPRGLQDISRRTGVHIVVSAGFYHELAQPERVREMPVSDLAAEIERDVTEGIGDTGIRAGAIGEIGIDSRFTAQEERGLRAACQAAGRSGVPLSIHTPGGSTRIHEYRRRICDIVEEEGASLRGTIIDHVMLRPYDLDEQMVVASRGAYLGFDGIGCDFDWGTRGSGPCDQETAETIRELVAAGFLDRILLSHDVHLKIMLTAYGGTGFGHLLRHFVPRLRRVGLTEAQIRTMLVDNPRRLFTDAAASRTTVSHGAKSGPEPSADPGA